MSAASAGRESPAHPAAPARLRGRRLALARSGWLLLAVLALGIAGADLAYSYRELSELAPASLRPGVTPQDVRAALGGLGLPAWFYAAYRLVLNGGFVLAFAAVAAAIFRRRSDEWMALFVGLFLVLFAANWVTGAAAPPRALAVLREGLEFLAWIAFLAFFFLFPDGRFVPRWTRWALVAWVALSVLFRTLPPPPRWLSLVSLLCVLGLAVFAQIYRYRRGTDPVQRQQAKWVVYGFSATFALFFGVTLLETTAIASSGSSPQGLLFDMIAGTLGVVLFLPIPLSIGIAVLRHRLFAIDVVINRTLVYGALTATLAGLYWLGVAVSQRLVGGLMGQQGAPLAIVASTLAIAALFQPLRRRLQRFIDRRFYRRKYDAAQTLAAFGARLRNETDLEHLSEQLVAVVEETMQPAQVSLWLKPPVRRE